jgi:CRISPR-associated protein Csd1
LSWMQRLCDTYNNCEAIGIVGLEPASDVQNEHRTDESVLLPIAHTVLKAHITVALDTAGNLLGARAQQDETGTVAPCTEDSESRSSTMAAPHPLFDKLQYLAGDYGAFTGQDNQRYFEAYLRQLEQWCQSPHSHPKVEAIYCYLQKGRLVADLVEKHVLYLGEEGLLLDKWEGGKDSAPDIFKIANCTPSKAIVRFTVNMPDDPENRVWMDGGVRQSFIAYTQWQQQDKRLCYVTGKVLPTIEKHPKKIVNTLANAKLISANDKDGFTYRGRFSGSSQAVSVGYDASLKAHNALRWLVDTRGRRFDTKVIVAWDTGNRELPSPVVGGDEFFGEEAARTAADLLLEANVRTEMRYSEEFNKALAGMHHRDLGDHGDVVVLALDSATVGRLSITYYRELRRGEYLESMGKWHKTCIWLIPGRNVKENRNYIYLGAPSSADVTLAVYGSAGSDKLKKAVPERLLTCIFDNARLPDDLVDTAVYRASNPVSLDRWEWNKTLSVACALYKKKHEKEGYDVALEENRADRSYLFGRLLAVADQIERWALAGEDRETNAMRYMNAFSKKPVETWRVISERLLPYQARLKGKASRLNDLITGITDKFEPSEYDKKPEEPLTGAYLLGFHSQRQVFLAERAERKKKAEEAKLKDQLIDNEDEYEED